MAACCWTDGQQVWLELPELGTLYISQAEIAVDLLPTADLDLLQVYLQGYALGIQAMLSQQFVLHATTLSRNSQAIVICGGSGLGKSTLAAALLQKGFALVSDEVTIIDPQGRVQPGFDDIKLWRDAVDVLQLPEADVQPVRSMLDKFYYRPATPIAQPMPVAAVYILESDNRNALTLEELKGFAKFEPLRVQAYRQFLLGPLQLNSKYMQYCGQRLGHIPLLKLTRSLQRLQAQVLEHLANAIDLDATGRGL